MGKIEFERNFFFIILHQFRCKSKRSTKHAVLENIENVGDRLTNNEILAMYNC